jgi:hypothetical protein
MKIHLADTRGKGNYLLSSTMTQLDHLIEAPSECGLEDANFLAFVEEFLACGLWPLSEKIGFPVERKESPLSKVMVPMS